MLILHQFPPALGLPSGSPFCMKLEAWLKLARIPYQTQAVFDPRQGPKGKAPFIEEDGRLIGDSALIIEHLARSRGVDPDAGLTQAERAVARALGLMLEEHLYWALVYSRWIEERGWPVVRDTFLAGRPPAVQDAIRDDMRTKLHLQGMGRHTAEEVYGFATADLEALAGWLDDKPFLMGEEPVTVDCIALGFLASALCTAFDTPLQAAVRWQPSLVRYRDRMMARFFPAFAEVDRAA